MPAQRVKGPALGCGIGRRGDLDLVLLWLWHRLAAVTLIEPSLGTSICYTCSYKNFLKNWTPSLGTSICQGYGPKKTPPPKKKEKKKKKKKDKMLKESSSQTPALPCDLGAM